MDVNAGMFVPRFFLILVRGYLGWWKMKKKRFRLIRVRIIKVIEMRDPCLSRSRAFYFYQVAGYSLVLDGGNGCGIVGRRGIKSAMERGIKASFALLARRISNVYVSGHFLVGVLAEFREDNK